MATASLRPKHFSWEEVWVALLCVVGSSPCCQLSRGLSEPFSFLLVAVVKSIRFAASQYKKYWEYYLTFVAEHIGIKLFGKFDFIYWC